MLFRRKREQSEHRLAAGGIPLAEFIPIETLISTPTFTPADLGVGSLGGFLLGALAGAHLPPFLILYVDGASKGNPGEAGAGWVAIDADGREWLRGQAYLGQTTNNEAEYQALLLALKALKDRKFRGRLTIRSDSQLLVNQLNGKYLVKEPNLVPLHRKVMRELRTFWKWKAEHVPREKNRLADQLANAAIRHKTAVSRKSMSSVTEEVMGPKKLDEVNISAPRVHWVNTSEPVQSAIGKVKGLFEESTALERIGGLIRKGTEIAQKHLPSIQGATHGVVNIAGNVAGTGLQSIEQLARTQPGAAGALALGVGGLAYLRRRRRMMSGW